MTENMVVICFVWEDRLYSREWDYDFIPAVGDLIMLSGIGFPVSKRLALPDSGLVRVHFNLFKTIFESSGSVETVEKLKAIGFTEQNDGRTSD